MYDHLTRKMKKLVSFILLIGLLSQKIEKNFFLVFLVTHLDSRALW